MQSSGFFVGLAFWPGGSVEDWGAVYNTTTNEFGLQPCNNTGNYSDSGLTPARYLVRPREHLQDLFHSVL